MTTDSGPTARWSLWLRWSWRDLRQHWVAVVAIALVLAIGTGVYAGLGSTTTWRRLSNDASFATLDMHDLQVSLSPGVFTDEGALLDALRTIEGADAVMAAQERLIVESQVDASSAGESILVPARLVGTTVDGSAGVDALWIRDGAAPAENANGAQGLLEAKFADDRDLPIEGVVTVGGGEDVSYVGLAIGPEEFYYEGPEGSIFSQGDLAIVYLPLATAQQVAGRPGTVNDLVLTLVDGTDRDAIESQLVEAVEAIGVSAIVSTREEVEAVRILYEDIDNDKQFWNALAGLILGAAALAAFNLVSRVVEAQRREIGIGMALGVPKHQLAIRPLLVGVQVAAIGTLAGIGVGWMVGQAMGDLIRTFLPLPIQRTPFQVDVYAQGAALGLLIPISAAAFPVWRAVRVEPIEAIRTGHLAAKTGRFTDWSARMHLPGSSLNQMPFRNVLRTPRRTFLTAVGVGAAITALVAVLGMLDSFSRTIDIGSDELTQTHPDRVMVQLDTFYPVDGEELAAIAAAPTVGAMDPTLRLPATALSSSDGEGLDLLVEIIDFDQATWRPTIEQGDGSNASTGIVLAPKAATDLGVSVGDSVSLRHPLRLGPNEFTLTVTDLVVSGVHANPMRAFAYLDAGHADHFGLSGAANAVHAYPVEGSTPAAVQRDLFDLPGVTSTQAVIRISEGFDEALEQFVGLLFITAGAVLVLALLIAFNATRITVEERRREHATMRAFGLPVRTVMTTVVKESLLVGVAATVIGLVAGSVFLRWMLHSLATRTLPDLGVDPYVSPTTMLLAIGVGIVAVALAPLFLVRRVQTMSIPDTLRIME